MRLFSDQQTLLLNIFQDVGVVRGPLLAPEAIATAYREIAGCLPWNYLWRRCQINTNPAFSSGSVGYVKSTNTLTLTGATWPAWTTQALIVINASLYAIQLVTSPTTATCVPNRAPNADVPSGTGFTLYQQEYALPSDFSRMTQLITLGNVWDTQEVFPWQMLDIQRFFYSPSRPWRYAIMGSTYFAGQMALNLAPAPDQNYTYDILYQAMPRQRTLASAYISNGTSQSIAVSGTAVTGTSTAFTSNMVGCRLRQAYSGLTAPTGEYGAGGSTNETTIQSVQSATGLTLVTPGVTASGVGFVIDDPVDVERQSMDEVFCRMCEYQFATLLSHGSAQDRYAVLSRALNIARARDVRTSERQNRNSPLMTLEALAYTNIHAQGL
jgi:hypothetical protein